MKVLTAAEMQQCDRITTENHGIASFDLMRNASSAVAAAVRLHFPQAERITVLCGRGNNGGDGMVTARLLASTGSRMSLLLLGSPDPLKGDAALAWSRLEGSGVEVRVVREASELARHSDLLDADLLIDAILGTGFQPPMRGLALAAQEWVGQSSTPILAVDLPSGWPADSTAAGCQSPVFPADAVVTFTAPKPAHLFGHLTRRWNQPVIVAPIGSPEEALTAAQSSQSADMHWAGAALELIRQPRSASSNKGNFGHVLVVGGSFGSAGGKAGAPAMAAMAALRSGAGLVTAAVPAPALGVVAGFAPELMTWPLPATPEGCIADSFSPDQIRRLIEKKTVLAIGPGLGQESTTRGFVQKLLAATTIPAVLDADALNLLAADPAWMEALSLQAKSGRVIVLTPHPGEMARLCNASTQEVQNRRPELALDFAGRTGFTLVLKGARTLIAHPDGSLGINTSGNPGMAKGGSGDLLTGLIASLLAQHPEQPARAMEAAVCLHGLSADLAVRRQHERTLLPTDTLAELARAFDFPHSGPGGYLWLQGQPPAEAESPA